MRKVEKWGMIEFRFNGKSDGNPFTDYEIHAEFKSEKEVKQVTGFYDGDGVYVVRFMPAFEGEYKYKAEGSFFAKGISDQAEISGEFYVTEPASLHNHGMVHVLDKRYLEYTDGTPHYSFGTTCYAWVHQKEELQEQTLDTLKNSSFNKIRFCIFPKYYRYNEEEPAAYPYIRGERRGLVVARRSASWNKLAADWFFKKNYGGNSRWIFETNKAGI